MIKVPNTSKSLQTTLAAEVHLMLFVGMLAFLERKPFLFTVTKHNEIYLWRLRSDGSL
jgi:hypothetical protein